MTGLLNVRLWEVYPEEALKAKTMAAHKSFINHKVIKLIPLGKSFQVLLFQFNCDDSFIYTDGDLTVNVGSN